VGNWGGEGSERECKRLHFCRPFLTEALIATASS
jgi:hypothetical protein